MTGSFANKTGGQSGLPDEKMAPKFSNTNQPSPEPQSLIPKMMNSEFQLKEGGPSDEKTPSNVNMNLPKDTDYSSPLSGATPVKARKRSIRKNTDYYLPHTKAFNEDMHNKVSKKYFELPHSMMGLTELEGE
mmetsp:Transcript_33238/g.50967  ORF Transcript_33238/g.50967 Transcript_33238/m.50967 type:complete len:132 (-) Transcript_33238:3412-3807(-)